MRRTGQQRHLQNHTKRRITLRNFDIDAAGKSSAISVRMREVWFQLLQIFPHLCFGANDGRGLLSLLATATKMVSQSTLLHRSTLAVRCAPANII